MKKIIGYFVRHSLVTNMLFVIIVILGIFTLRKIPRESMPNVDLNQLSVVTIYPGASTEDVELNVTCKIEDALREVEGIREITSVSMENSSSIMIQIDEDLSKEKAQETSDEIKDAVMRINDLPEEIEDRPEVTELKSSDFPIIEIALSHSNIEFLRSRMLSIENTIKQTPGVAGVDKVGYYDKEIHIEVDPDKLQKAYISLPEIIRSIQERNLSSSGGTLKSYRGLKTIVVLNKFKNPMAVKYVILRSNFDLKQIKIMDIAEVRETYKDHKMIVRNNGNPGMSLIVRKKENADIIRTLDRIKKKLKALKTGGLKMTYINDRSRMTRTRLSLLYSNGAFGFILVVFFLILFLNKQSALWTAVGIPFCFIGSFIFFPQADLTINNVSLAAMIIILGMIVDDAIVVAEKISYFKEQGMNSVEAAVQGSLKMAAPITAAALTTMGAFFPIFFIGGKAGKFAWAMPTVVIIALIISLFECFFILPNHLAHEKSRKKNKTEGTLSKKPKWMISLENSYETALRKVLSFRLIFVSVAVIVLTLCLLLTKKYVKFQMFPQSGADTFYLKIEGPRDSALEKTDEKLKRIEKIVAKLPENELMSYTSRSGHMSTSASKNLGDHENWGIVSVFLTPDTERTRGAKEIIQELRKKMKQSKILSPYKLKIEVKKQGPVRGKPVNIHLTSHSMKTLIKAEKKIMDFLSTMKERGVSDIDSDRKRGKDELVLNIDHKRMASLGISTKDVAQSLRIAFDGSVVTSIQTPLEEIEYRVIFDRKSRSKRDAISKIAIKNQMGKLIPISSFTSFTVREGDLARYHRNHIRSIEISAELNPKIMTANTAAKYIKENLLNPWEPPRNLKIEIGGEAEQTREMFQDVGFAVILAFLIIFGVISIVLYSVKQSLIIMSVIPFGLTGILFAVLSHGENLSMFVLLAVCSLIGIVVNDSIVMVATLNEAFKKCKVPLPSVKEKIDFTALHAKTRLRPILLTTLTTLGGLFPMGYGLGGKDAMLSPMALALGWGLLFATVITLFLIPAFYTITEVRKN